MRRYLREAQWVGPVLGALAGGGLAVVFDAVTGEPDPTGVAVSVDRARDSMWGALGLLFAGLSIVLALTALTSQNMASRFSPRLLRVKLRLRSEKSVLFVFAFASSYIMTELALQRSRPGDSPAPPVGLAGGMVLLILTAVVIVWYITHTLRSLRVDLTVRWVGSVIVEAARSVGHIHRHDIVIPIDGLAFTEDAVAVHALSTGYLAEVDLDHLHRLAVDDGLVIAVTTDVGQLVLPGDTVGWIRGSGIDQTTTSTVAAALELAESRDPARDIDYDVGLLVDIALMAMSPAVGDDARRRHRTGGSRVDCRPRADTKGHRPGR